MPNNEANNSDTRREDWGTPQWLFDRLNEIFHFAIDLAANEVNHKCEKYIDEKNNFFSFDFRTLPIFAESDISRQWKWCNPPYGRGGCKKWVNALFDLYNVVVLIPASVGAKWFTTVWTESDSIVFLNERLSFAGSPFGKDGKPQTAQFDSCLAIRGTDGIYPDIENLADLGLIVKTRGNITIKKEPRVFNLG